MISAGRPPYASAITRRRRMGIAWRIDRRPSLLKWAKDLAFASHLRSEPFGPVLHETVARGLESKNQRGTSRRDASKCHMVNQMDRGLLGVLRHRSERLCDLGQT